VRNAVVNFGLQKIIKEIMFIIKENIFAISVLDE
jgi:hypothetical protein